MGGGSFYSGDLTKPNLSVLQETNPTFGILGRYNANPLFSLRGSFLIGSLSGNDRNYSSDEFRMARAFQFSTSFTEYALALEWHILGNRRMNYAPGEHFMVWPYLYLGGGYFKYSPKANFEATMLGQDLGKLIVDDIEASKPGAEIVPSFGFGAHIDVNPQFYIGIELGLRPAMTDYLDGVSFAADPSNEDWYGTLLLQFNYRFGFPDRDGDNVADHKDDCPDEPGLASINGCPDSDNDGLADKIDSCPFEAGLMALGGCPDTDGDGIADIQDRCPTEFGPLSQEGCPVIVVDSDGDGIVDEEDNCPDEPGTRAAGGCPVKDTDQDGVLDYFDECPEVYGLAVFNGCPDTDGDGIADSKDKCPELFGHFDADGCPLTDAPDQAIENINSIDIFFDADSYEIKLEYYQELNKIADFLSKFPDYVLEVRGFSDSYEGKDSGRRWLAKRRAEAIVQFLRSENINAEQLKVFGMGIDYRTSRRDYRRRVDFALVKRKVKP